VDPPPVQDPVRRVQALVASGRRPRAAARRAAMRRRACSGPAAPLCLEVLTTSSTTPPCFCTARSEAASRRRRSVHPPSLLAAALPHSCRAGWSAHSQAAPPFLHLPRTSSTRPGHRSPPGPQAAQEQSAASHLNTLRPRLHPVQAPKLDRGEPLVNPHHFPGPSRRRPRRILDFPAGRCARGLHCFDFSLSREFSVIQGPLRNLEKILRGPPCKCVIRVSAATLKNR
jgi:hypothetical protein